MQYALTLLFVLLCAAAITQNDPSLRRRIAELSRPSGDCLFGMLPADVCKKNMEIKRKQLGRVK